MKQFFGENDYHNKKDKLSKAFFGEGFQFEFQTDVFNAKIAPRYKSYGITSL